jgi:hypothetical protein
VGATSLTTLADNTLADNSRAGVSAHTVGEIIEIDYGAARARVTRSITRLPTEMEADVFRDGLAWPGSVIESFEYEYLDE